MNKNQGFVPIIIIIVIVVLAVGGIAYYTGKNSGSVSNNTKDNMYSPQGSARLAAFTGSKGVFSAQSYGLTKVDVYFVPTGTEVTSSDYLGTMILVNTSTNGLQTWSLSAYSTVGADGIEKEGTILATSIYAVGFVENTEQNRIDYSYTGASDIYNHLY